MADIKAELTRIQEEITNGLAWAASGYAKAGLSFTRYSSGAPANPQVAIGNLSISIELLLKAFIAKRSFLLLYPTAPLELRSAFSAPESLPASFRLIPYEIELKSSSYKSIELEEVISTFGVFCPDLKQRLGPHLRFLARHRNTCVHGVHPDFRDYEVNRVAFVFLTLIAYFKNYDPLLIGRSFMLDDEANSKFMAQFNEDRLNCVHKKMEAAREIAKGLTGKLSFIAEEWEWYPIQCPVCLSDGILSGETTAETDFDEDGPCGGFTLSFAGESFTCQACGLSLDDYDELVIARIDPDVDRSEESCRWHCDHSDDNDDEYGR